MTSPSSRKLSRRQVDCTGKSSLIDRVITSDPSHSLRARSPGGKPSGSSSTTLTRGGAGSSSRDGTNKSGDNSQNKAGRDSFGLISQRGVGFAGAGFGQRTNDGGNRGNGSPQLAPFFKGGNLSSSVSSATTGLWDDDRSGVESPSNTSSHQASPIGLRKNQSSGFSNGNSGNGNHGSSGGNSAKPDLNNRKPPSNMEGQSFPSNPPPNDSAKGQDTNGSDQDLNGPSPDNQSPPTRGKVSAHGSNSNSKTKTGNSSRKRGQGSTDPSNTDSSGHPGGGSQSKGPQDKVSPNPDSNGGINMGPGGKGGGTDGSDGGGNGDGLLGNSGDGKGTGGAGGLIGGHGKDDVAGGSGYGGNSNDIGGPQGNHDGGPSIPGPGPTGNSDGKAGAGGGGQGSSGKDGNGVGGIIGDLGKGVDDTVHDVGGIVQDASHDVKKVAQDVSHDVGGLVGGGSKDSPKGDGKTGPGPDGQAPNGDGNQSKPSSGTSNDGNAKNDSGSKDGGHDNHGGGTDNGHNPPPPPPPPPHSPPPRPPKPQPQPVDQAGKGASVPQPPSESQPSPPADPNDGRVGDSSTEEPPPPPPPHTNETRPSPANTQPLPSIHNAAAPAPTMGPVINAAPDHDVLNTPSSGTHVNVHDDDPLTTRYTLTTLISTGVFTVGSTTVVDQGRTTVIPLTSTGTRTITTQTAIATSGVDTSRSNIGPSKAIVGGVIGGTVVIILLLIVFLVLRRRRRSQRGILLATSEPNETMPKSRNVLSAFRNGFSGSRMTEVGAFRAVNQTSVESVHQVAGETYGFAAPGPVKKKPVPALDDELLGSSSNMASLPAPVSNVGALKMPGSTPSDNPYEEFLVHISNSALQARGSAHVSNTSLESIPNPFADPEDPFSDPRNYNRLSAHSGNSDLSYDSLHSSQGGGLMGNADVIRHASMKSGLSYASLTPSQVQRHMNYVPPPLPPAALSDTSSERRLSEQSTMTMSSIGTVRGL